MVNKRKLLLDDHQTAEKVTAKQMTKDELIKHFSPVKVNNPNEPSVIEFYHKDKKHGELKNTGTWDLGTVAPSYNIDPFSLKTKKTMWEKLINYFFKR